MFECDRHSFIPAFRQTVTKFTSLNVATSNVNDVNNTSLKLVGKCLEKCPSRKTAKISENVAVNSVQVGQKLQGENYSFGLGWN